MINQHTRTNIMRIPAKFIEQELNIFKIKFKIVPGKSATLDCSFKSQIFTNETDVPVPKIRPSGWNCAVVNAIPVEPWSAT